MFYIERKLLLDVVTVSALCLQIANPSKVAVEQYVPDILGKKPGDRSRKRVSASN